MAEQQIITPEAGTALSTPPSGARRLFGQADGWRGLVGQPAVRKALPGLALVGSVGLAAIAYFSLQSPAQAPLFQGLADADKAAVAGALQSAGIAYTLDQGSGAIQVGEDDVHKARMMLAGQGLPKAAPSGDTLISSIPMGSSRAVEGETLRGAREADLARTIEAIDAVKTARIHISQPEPSVFVRDAVKSAASVMLTLQAGRSLSDAQVQAIQHLVASAVPGMTPEDVSVVDQSGKLLSDREISPDNQNFELQLRVEERYRNALTALLEPIIGRENFSTEVHVDLDFSESQSTRETYPKEDRALRSEEGNRTTSGEATPPAAVGIPGALSNQPPPASQVATTPGGTQAVPGGSGGAAGSGQSAETYARNFDVGREISVTHNPQGKIARVTVAVALRDAKGAKPRPPAEIAAIDALVKGAVGFDARRGDVVAINARPFADVEAVQISWWDRPWVMPLLRQIGGLLIALLVLFFVARPLVKTLKARNEAANAIDTEMLEQSLLAEVQPSEEGGVTFDMIESAPNYQDRVELVRNFVKQDPARAAAVVRQLMRERSDER